MVASIATRSLCFVSLVCAAQPVLAGGDTWPTFADETAIRLLAIPSVGTADTQEKDYAWGDVDKDGDIDLICVRKQPWNTLGRFRNVLFMNEGITQGHAINGVLVDRTAEFATEATDGGQGMLDLTNDRDVVLVDVNGDTWLDIVTATTYGQGLAKTISHPRVYINKGMVGGVWQGFRYKESRTPTMPIAPNFCGIGYGDVSGDASVDLYFVDYNNNLEDRLWINDGTGTFVDESVARMTFAMRESDFGVHAVIADINGDGVNDVVKDRGSSASSPPLRITTSYNNAANEGFFNAFQLVYTGEPYHIEVGDLNGDGLLDIVVEDDQTDRYFLNQGNGPNGQANFLGFTFSNQGDSFGGNIIITDLDQDGHNDVLIADVDVDCCGCNRHMRLWRNLGNVPNITFQPEPSGVPVSARTGTHDVAVFDINGDQWLDLVIGTCTGTSVWIAQPKLAFAYPQGLPPDLIPPDEDFNFQVEIQQIAGAQVDRGSAIIHTSVNGGRFIATAMDRIAENLFLATLRATECPDSISFYVSAAIASGEIFTDPPTAPASTFSAVASIGTKVVFSDNIEGDVSGWTIASDPSLTAGEWEQADPNVTISSGQLAAPEDDATPGAANVMAFVTDNGQPGGNANANDVDWGPTYLISPTINLQCSNAIISYERWVFSDFGQPDVLTVDVSNDNGQTWKLVETVSGTDSAWQLASFVVSDFVTPTAMVRVRFGSCDFPNDSVTEAGIDDFQVEKLICPQPGCPADITGPGTVPDGCVDAFDLGAMLGAWCSAVNDPNPPSPPCENCTPANLAVADISGAANVPDGCVDAFDLAKLLAAWCSVAGGNPCGTCFQRP